MSQHAMAEMPVTMAMAPAAVFGNDASLLIPLFINGADANAAPVTNTRAICIENPSRFQTPPPQLFITSIKLWSHTGIATMTATNVSITAKINGSGRYLCMKLTQPLIIF